MYYVRLVPDDTKIPFMRGAALGLIVSGVLSVLSVILFFYPGLNYGIDFAGGIIVEARTPEAADFPRLRSAFQSLEVGEVAIQQFGAPTDVLVRLERQAGDESMQERAVTAVRGAIEQVHPGSIIRRIEAVGASVSRELFQNGMLALGLASIAMLAYISFRFEWQFGVGAVVTMILDITKTVGFYVITGLPFNLIAIAAILTIMGYSVNDKVVVYDRIRENLRIYKSMPLRELIDLSINETLNRTIGTSLAIFLATLPLVIFGGKALEDFSIVLLFGVVLATSSSIFIAAPIVLYLGGTRLRRSPAQATTAPAVE